MTITAPDPTRTETLRPIPRIVSVDDHVIEPADTWTKRLPAKYREIGPRLERLRVANLAFDGMNYSFDIVDTNSSEGKLADFWCYEDLKVPMRRIITAVGFEPEERTMLPVTYEEMRKGCWDQAARIADMDANHT
ncbi:MAG: amidohydrolase, partial [Acidobacteria bacterium]|nr:amidohydrolase [Acidobacteriota bacterium]